MRAPEQTFSYPYPHPAVTTDVVVFTIREGCLSILLVKRAIPPYQGCWALPGGFLDVDEDLDNCAARELQEETGIGGLYLEQLYTFGKTGRDPRERVISVTYYALVPLDAIATPRAASDAAAVGWHAFDALPQLAFDHAEIIAMAHRRMVLKGYEPEDPVWPSEFMTNRIERAREKYGHLVDHIPALPVSP